MKTKKLQEIKDRCDKATEGPWEQGQSYFVCTAYKVKHKGREMIQEITGSYGPSEVIRHNPQQSSPDHEFIAHARTDVPMLLEMVTLAENEFGYHNWFIERLDKIMEKYK